MFLADLSQQQLAVGQIQPALNLALESVRMRDDGVINQQSYDALLDVVYHGYFAEVVMPPPHLYLGCAMGP